MPTVITCPSGLSGEIRGLKGKEGKLLADRASAKSGVTFDRILAGCWLATNKPAEFIVLRISQDTRALEAELAAAGA